MGLPSLFSRSLCPHAHAAAILRGDARGFTGFAIAHGHNRADVRRAFLPGFRPLLKIAGKTARAAEVDLHAHEIEAVRLQCLAQLLNVALNQSARISELRRDARLETFAVECELDFDVSEFRRLQPHADFLPIAARLRRDVSGE